MAAVRIPLPDGREALVSKEDAYLAARSWRWSQGYVVCKERIWSEEDSGFRWVVLRLHREVLGTRPGTHIYFRDGNPLNCQRSNLTTEYTNRPGRKTGRRKGDPSNDGGWTTRRNGGL